MDLSTYHGGAGPSHQAVVKNTFVDIIESSSADRRLRRSASEETLSKSSSSTLNHDQCLYWVPSLFSDSDREGSIAGGATGNLAHRSFEAWQTVPPVEPAESSPAEHAALTQYPEKVPRPSFAGVDLPPSPEFRVALPDFEFQHSSGGLAEETLAEINRCLPFEVVQELAMSGVLARIPRTEDGQLASVGSISHESGECSPCAFWVNGICKNSISCGFCHLVHVGAKNKRTRPSKAMRMRHLRRVAKAEEADLWKHLSSDYQVTEL